MTSSDQSLTESPSQTNGGSGVNAVEQNGSATNGNHQDAARNHDTPTEVARAAMPGSDHSQAKATQNNNNDTTKGATATTTNLEDDITATDNGVEDLKP